MPAESEVQPKGRANEAWARSLDSVTPVQDPLKGDPAEATIREMATVIALAADPLAVILFGSRARGEHRPNSDIDLLVVLPEETNTRRAAAALDDLLARAFLDGDSLPEDGLRDVDIIASTPSRLKVARGDEGSVLHWACVDGVTLYQRQGAATPAES